MADIFSKNLILKFFYLRRRNKSFVMVLADLTPSPLAFAF
jgi:hypothetical protein